MDGKVVRNTVHHHLDEHLGLGFTHKGCDDCTHSNKCSCKLSVHSACLSQRRKAAAPPWITPRHIVSICLSQTQWKYTATLHFSVIIVEKTSKLTYGISRMESSCQEASLTWWRRTGLGWAKPGMNLTQKKSECVNNFIDFVLLQHVKEKNRYNCITITYAVKVRGLNPGLLLVSHTAFGHLLTTEANCRFPVITFLTDFCNNAWPRHHTKQSPSF